MTRAGRHRSSKIDLVLYMVCVSNTYISLCHYYQFIQQLAATGAGEMLRPGKKSTTSGMDSRWTAEQALLVLSFPTGFY